MTLIRKTLPLLPMDGRELLAAVREATDDELDLAEGYLYAAQQALYSQVRRAAHYVQFELLLPCFPSNGDADSFGLSRGGYTNNFSVPFTGAQFAAGPISGIELRVLPFLKLDSVQYYDADNQLQTFAAANYIVVPGGQDRPATIFTAPDISWPVTSSRPDAVRITFWAGEVCQVNVVDSGGTLVFQSADGFQFSDNDQITISVSANTNPFLGEEATLPGTEALKTYYVVGAAADKFSVSLSEGGDPVSLTAPANATVFAGTLSPLVKRVLMTTATNWWLNRCPVEECTMGDAERISKYMSLLQWNYGYGD